MQARHPLIHGILYAGLLVSASSSAQFRADPNLKGSGLDGNYGTYAPRGDCTREPRITVDDSGFTFRYGQHVTHPPTVATAGGWFGRQDTLLAFFPFPTGVTQGESGLEAANPGPLLMALDTQAFTLALSASNPRVPLTPLQQALIKHSPYARCGVPGAASHATGLSTATAPATATPQPDEKPLQINFGKDAIKPSAAQTAAIRRATADDLKDPVHPGQPLYAVAVADLNDDGRPDLLIQYTYASGFCGSTGCSGIILMATPSGYASKGIDLPNCTTVAVLPAMHHGMHDLQYDGDSPIWKWNGKKYDIAKADLPGANAPAWVTRQATGHPMMAVATPIDSTIKNLLVFCEQGTPLLAMVTRMPRPAGSATLTFVFRGWTVNVPLQQNTQETRLWVANLSRSDLPMWLAHRGTDSRTSELARLADMSFLRINGVMEGQISLENSTAATQAALSSCYRY